MSLLARRREFLSAYRKTGSIEAAAKALNLEPSIHDEWMKDWLYRGAFAETVKEMKGPPPPPRRPPGRPRKALPEAPPPPKRPRGRPPKSSEIQPGGQPRAEKGAENEPRWPHTLPEPLPETPPAAPETPAAPPVMVEHTFEGKKGYVRLYTPEGEVPAAPETEKTEKTETRRQAQEPEPALEVTVSSDEQQRALVDEYGELDRRMQLRATDTARYESLKKAIKSWFAAVPPDADGTVEGDVYLLHLSACERERKIRSVRELVEEIGLDKVLDLAVVPIGQLENVIGKTRVAGMTIETRTGSRRIKAIPKRPAAVDQRS